MKAEEIQLAQDWVLIKPDKLKTFKETEFVPVLPKENMNVVKDEEDELDPIQEVEEIERTLAFVIQRGTIVAIGPGESMYEVGDSVFIKHLTGVDFQWVGSPAKSTCPKLMKKYEIIGKVK